MKCDAHKAERNNDMQFSMSRAKWMLWHPLKTGNLEEKNSDNRYALSHIGQCMLLFFGINYILIYKNWKKDSHDFAFVHRSIISIEVTMTFAFSTNYTALIKTTTLFLIKYVLNVFFSLTIMEKNITDHILIEC